jgi:peptidoglycan hydrolase-like protein with peptidoglycan-binding domain
VKRRLVIVVMGLALLGAACSDTDGDGDVEADPVAAAEARVASAEQDVKDAQVKYDKASDEFCADAKSYITAVDRYGNVFDNAAATVGDVKTAGADLVDPRKEVTSSAEPVVDANEELAAAKQDLAEAQVALVEAKSGTTTVKPDEDASTTTTEPLLPVATVDRVEKAESDLTAAQANITNSTPVAEAAVQFNSAAFALEIAWLRLFADAGCFTEEQQAQAVTSVANYTVALQNVLKNAGYYSGEVDGIYGPSTVDAVKKVQTEASLPVTGYVDQATAAFLNAKRAAVGGAVASTTVTYTAAVQSTLKLAGFWDGPIDGNWTPALTEAVTKFQTELGVEPTGAIDSATLHALETRISETKSGASSSTTTTSGSSGSTTTTAPTTTTTAA